MLESGDLILDTGTMGSKLISETAIPARNCAKPPSGGTIEDVEHTQRRQTAAASWDVAVSPTLKRQGLFPCEAEIARRLSQSEKRWRAISKVLEREGLPKTDPLMGARFWPAVVAFFQVRYGIGDVNAPGSVMMIPGPPDGEEHWDAV